MTKIKKRRSRKNQEYVQSFLFFLSSILSIAGLLVYLWVYTEIDETVINIETQKQVAFELQNSIDELEIEISRLSRGDRISRVARSELQMVPAKPETIMIYIDKSDIVKGSVEGVKIAPSTVESNITYRHAFNICCGDTIFNNPSKI